MQKRIAFTVAIFAFAALARAESITGFYRQPALHEDTIVFVSEGDLWKVGTKGGVATRLTTHPGEEGMPAISPDGETLAFTATYEGSTELYTMPLAGGRPTRRTHAGARISFVGWTPDGKLLYGTDAHARLPGQQLVTLDIHEKHAVEAVIPLAQAADGCYDDAGKTLFFTRLPFQGSHTKRYQGGTAQSLWKFAAGADEAVPLTGDFRGTSKAPMWWKERIYFLSDRDGSMNLWSMTPAGDDPKQHTKHAGWDATSPSLSHGRIAYQLGADIHIYDIAGNVDRNVPIQLESDLDQEREQWVKKPLDYLTSYHLSPDGSSAVLTARGRAFVAPQKQGRFVDIARLNGGRCRDVRFMPDGKTLLALSDNSGEVELWTVPANGLDKANQLTRDGDVLRIQGLPSPDGKTIAHHDKNLRLFLHDVGAGTSKQIDQSKIDEFSDVSWSPDGKFLAYVAVADNMFRQIKLYSAETGNIVLATSDRFDSFSPAWSADGHWLYFLSDRNLKSIVPSPWGSYQPEPFLDRKTKIYQLALTEGLRSPFTPADELHPEKKEDKKDAAPVVKIDLDGLQKRLQTVPVPPGNYSNLSVTDKAIFWLTRVTGESKLALAGLPIGNDIPEVKTVVPDIRSYEVSADGKKLAILKEDPARKDSVLYILDAVAAPADLARKELNLSAWTLAVDPRDEWRQMFTEAWRLERDYFYDRNMHGVDWKAILKKYEPLLVRVHSRAELSDLTAQMVSELSALHIFVRGGDMRKGSDQVQAATLGAELVRDEAKGGYVVRHIYRSDPDTPERAGPLDHPNAKVKEGDVIEAINGTDTLTASDIQMLLRNKAGQQVLLRVKSHGSDKARETLVRPTSASVDADLRYREWEYTRRLAVEDQGKGDIGYVHLRAMGGDNYTEWAESFYPSFNRKGLIVDVRNNRGGNIDSWIMSKLLRKAWFYWSPRVGQPPSWNMQYAFRGHVVVLCNEFTASDGEAFAEGVKRLGIGKVIGTRTWGGEIWLSFDNTLVDKGIATAAEFGVFGPEGAWLIEGHGVDPDMVVDNLPHATFKGEDAQLKAAIAHLQKMIKEKPVEALQPPPRPIKGSGR